MPALGWWAARRRWIPLPVRRLLFRLWPGRWTEAEVSEIRARAKAMAIEMREYVE